MKELKTKKDLDEDTERPQTKKKRKFRLLFQRSEEPQFEPLEERFPLLLIYAIMREL